ncbi:hypothetical protein H5V43_02200 [Sphingobium fuliginis]|uniref:Uncharacterized protein n=1 Tax=Sphingobium fuliginis (strain ATCC 27551) TaxID=336203 RepID=A0A7M2GHL7_SPHSA|nr:hypothetical protein [Sphingobium fuliginis]QOT72008.1 hypothetical protein H5V43_02200 [Sphingobium fuliginis]
MLLLLLALAASTSVLAPAQAVNPGLPPPLPGGMPFDFSSVCYVVMTAEAEKLHAQNKTSRYEDAASGYFAAQLSQAHPGSEQDAIAKAKNVIAGRPERYHLNCADAFSIGYAPLHESPPGVPR